MEIGLREWLVIGGVLLIVLIILDGWRRMRGSRQRLRMDIDPAAADLPEEPVRTTNPELPNGGSRVVDDPLFADLTSPAVTESESPPDSVTDPDLHGHTEPVLNKRVKEKSVRPAESLSPVSPLLLSEKTGGAGEDIGSVRILSEAEGQKEVADPAIEADDWLPESDPLSLPDDEWQGSAIPGYTSAREADAAQKEYVEDLEISTEDLAALQADVSTEKVVRLTPEMSSAPSGSDPEPLFPDPYFHIAATASQPVEVTGEQAIKQVITGAEGADDIDLDKPIPLNFNDAEITEVVTVVPPVPAKEEASSRSSEQSPAEVVLSEPVVDALPQVAPAETAPVECASLEKTPDPESVLVIMALAAEPGGIQGAQLLPLVTACGMRYGDMDIFHRFEDGLREGALQFSMANALNPGTFDIKAMDQMSTQGLTFFMSMDEPKDVMNAFECMLATAETVAKHMGVELLDENRSVLRPQTKEHYRQRIRDFEMRNLSRRAH
ncbi:MAG: cell division protein ZipA [Pontibacterium sp.]